MVRNKLVNVFRSLGVVHQNNNEDQQPYVDDQMNKPSNKRLRKQQTGINNMKTISYGSIRGGSDGGPENKTQANTFGSLAPMLYGEESESDVKL